jgi:hypothetical protein
MPDGAPSGTISGGGGGGWEGVPWMVAREDGQAAAPVIGHSFVPNDLHLGMERDLYGEPIPHGWLSSGERILTPGLDPRKGAHLITL